MHVENQRHAAGLAEASISKLDTVSFDELCGCGLMRMSRHV
jgi:hypothetical protein